MWEPGKLWVSSQRRAAPRPEVPPPWSAPGVHVASQSLQEPAGLQKSWGPLRGPRARACWPRTAQRHRPDPASLGPVSAQSLGPDPPLWAPVSAQPRGPVPRGHWCTWAGWREWDPGDQHTERPQPGHWRGVRAGAQGESRAGKAREGPATGLTPPGGSGSYITRELGPGGCGRPIPGQWVSRPRTQT